MNRIVLERQINDQGMLEMQLPIGIEEAGREVRVTVEPLEAAAEMSHEEWRAWVQDMAGSWQGELERPPQGELEVRDPLP